MRMLLFEFDQGQLYAARVGSGQGECPDPEVMSAVRDSVLQIVGRPLFPVRWTDSGDSGFDGPDRLVAMDPSGQVVSVEVVPVLTSAGLVEALARSGRTASLGWVDLSEAYPRGAASFRSDWNEFRGGMPPRPLPGPRLYVLTGEVHEEVRPALEMLADSGIEVYEARQRSLNTGRVIVEIDEPYRVSIPTIGPTVARLAGRRPDLLEDSDEMSRMLEIAPDGDQLVADIASVPGALSHPVPPRRGRRAAAAPVDAIPERGLSAASPEPAPAEAPTPEIASPPSPQQPDVVPSPQVAASPEAPAERAEAPAVEQPVQATGADAPAVRTPAAERTWRSPRVDPAMAALATALKDEQRLSWVQLRKGIRHEVTLRADGLLEADDGREFADPSEAARALSGRYAADGWRVWRLPDGRTIDEAIEQYTAGIR